MKYIRKRKISRIPAVSAFLILTLTGCIQMMPQSTKIDADLVLRNGLIIDGTGAGIKDNLDIVIQNEVIVEIVPTGSAEYNPKAEIVNLNGSYVLPGLINTHVHGVYDREALRSFAYSGVTTVRDMQDSNEDRFENWSWFEERDRLMNDPYSSRLLVVGPMLTVPGGYPVCFDDLTEKALLIESAHQAAETTQKLIDLGADSIKISIENGITYFLPFNLPMFSSEEVGVIVETAHRNNIKVTAHITNSGDIPLFLEAGGDEIAHMVIDDGLDGDIVDRLVEAGISWAPTLELWARVEQLPYVLAAAPDYKSLEPAISNLRRFYLAGGRVVLGTDFGGLPGGVEFETMPITELVSMKKAGMTNMDIIVAATGNAAEACGVANYLGTIERGKVADLLIVGGNPLEDLHSLSDPLMVIHNGIIIRDDGFND